MLQLLRGSAHPEVAHVLSLALEAYFKIGVAMEVCKFVGVDATLPVESVDVLADNCFQNVSIH